MKRDAVNGRFLDGNEGGPGGPMGHCHNQKHGGAAAVKAIGEGREFRGLAAETEQTIKADLQALGMTELVRREAVRLATACQLYWDAVQSSADEGNLDRLNAYTKTYGWLASCTLRAWAQLAQAERESARAGLQEILAAPVGGDQHGSDTGD